MSKRIWSPDLITAEIRRLHGSGSDITQSWVESIDSRLTSAAIRYFGSWRAAVEAAGINYTPVAEVGRKRRSEKMTKWSRESILEEIRRLHEQGEDLASSVVRRKHLALYATARRKEHFGSWSEAVTAAGIDYDAVKQESQARRKRMGDWKRRLLLEWEQPAAAEPVTAGAAEPELASAAPDWARDLLHEKLSEIYDAEESEADVPDALAHLIGRDGAE